MAAIYETCHAFLKRRFAMAVLSVQAAYTRIFSWYPVSLLDKYCNPRTDLIWPGAYTDGKNATWQSLEPHSDTGTRRDENPGVSRSGRRREWRSEFGWGWCANETAGSLCARHVRSRQGEGEVGQENHAAVRSTSAVVGVATAGLDLLGKVMCRDIMRFVGVLHTIHMMRMGGRGMGRCLCRMSRTGLDTRKLGMNRHRYEMQRNK